MVLYVIRRLLISVGVMLVASWLVFVLASNAGDPLEDLRTSHAQNREELIALRVAELHLNVPVGLRYFAWLWGVVKGLWGQLDLGMSHGATGGAAVTDLLAHAVP